MVKFDVRLAATPAEIEAAQHLRYTVFATEFGSDGPSIDHAKQSDCDAFDAVADHLLLIDTTADNRVVGTYRIIQQQAAGRFYSAQEFDLNPLLQSGKRIAEIGRSCIAAEYRGGTGLMELWHGLGRYVADHDIEMLFGVASFAGQDLSVFAHPLSYLYHHARAPDAVRPVAIGDAARAMNLLAKEDVDRRAAMVQMPALIKAYLRLGGQVGDGVFLDAAFQSIDVCMILDTAQMSARNAALFGVHADG